MKPELIPPPWDANPSPSLRPSPGAGLSPDDVFSLRLLHLARLQRELWKINVGARLATHPHAQMVTLAVRVPTGPIPVVTVAWEHGEELFIWGSGYRTPVTDPAAAARRLVGGAV